MSKAIGEKIAIKFDQNLNNPFTELAELDIASNSHIGRVYTAGSTASPNEPENAFDGDNATKWQAGGYRTLTWIKVDLGEELTARQITIRSPGSGGYYSAWDLHASNDDSNWDLILQGTHTSYGQDVTVDFPEDKTYRYWRITGTNRVGNYPGVSRFVLIGDMIININAGAFTVKGNERSFPDGVLVEREYPVHSVDEHPLLDEQHVLLTMVPLTGPESLGGGRFRDVVGNLTVAYDMTKGNLAGIGGAVLSFEDVFTPTDLLPLPSSAGQAEKLDASITNYELGTIAPVGGYGPEILETSITNYELELRDPLDP